MEMATAEEELNLRNLTDKQFSIIAEQFIGRRGSIEQVLSDLGVSEPIDLIETELWTGGFKRCPGCDMWHDNLWHSTCAGCRAWRKANQKDPCLKEQYQ